MKVVEGKVAVVTGAASGIGRAMARTFGAAGMKVALADVEMGALRETRKEIAADGVEAAAFACDVSQADAVHKLAEDARSAFGGGLSHRMNDQAVRPLDGKDHGRIRR